MPSSESPNLPAASRRRVQYIVTPRATKTVTFPWKEHVDSPKKPTKYIKGLKTRERVDMVLSELNEKHRWSIKDFIYHLVTAEPTKKYAMSC